MKRGLKYWKAVRQEYLIGLLCLAVLSVVGQFIPLLAAKDGSGRTPAGPEIRTGKITVTDYDAAPVLHVGQNQSHRLPDGRWCERALIFQKYWTPDRGRIWNARKAEEWGLWRVEVETIAPTGQIGPGVLSSYTDRDMSPSEIKAVGLPPNLWKRRPAK